MKIRLRSLVSIVAAMLVFAPGYGVGQAIDPPEDPAASRVRSTMDAAVTAGPDVSLRVAGLMVESAETFARLGAGVPRFDWQREGVGSGFNYEPNGVEKFRLSTPFNLPWRIGQAHDVREQSALLMEVGARAAALEVAAWVGGSWLDLAAETEVTRVANLRIERLQRALTIQRRKYELGEISGSEKTQLELEFARDSAFAQQSLGRQRKLQYRIEAAIGGEFAGPEAGDLASLARARIATAQGNSSSTPNAAIDELVTGSVHMQAAEARSEVSRLEAKLSKSTAWGRPEADIEWERIPEFDGIEGYDAFGFRIGLPLHIGKTGHRRIAAAEMQAEAAAREQDRQHLLLEGRLGAAIAAADAAESMLNALEPMLAEAAQTDHSLTEQFRLGAITYLVYLDGLRRLDQMRLQEIEALRSLLMARLEMAGLLADATYFPIPELLTSTDPITTDSTEATP